MAVAQVLLLAAVLLHRSAAVPACPESCTCQNPALLNCSSSGLTVVPQHIPDSVTELDLSENLLDSVRMGRRQSRLRNVWLGNSRITHLSLCLERSPGGRYVTGRKRRCVPWAPTLQLLSVERNQLEQLPHGLQSCESLQVLQLSFNRISTLRPQDFDNLRKLKELDLKHNLITSLHPQTFKGLAQLQVLDLSFNMLTSLHPSMYLSLHNIGANVKLAGNSWKCDCSMRSLRRQMGYDGSRGPHAWSVVCASPSKLSGKDLLHLEEDDLNCFAAENSPERHQSVTVFSGSEILLSCSAQDLMGRTPSGQASVNQPEAGLLIKDITERDTGLYVCVSEEQEDVAVFNLQISKVGGAQRKARSLPGNSGQAISQGISNRIGNERNQRATSSQLALAVCLSILFTFLVAFILGVLARPCIDVLLKRICKKKSSTATNTVSTVEQSQYDNEAYSEIEEREVSGTHRERRVTFSNVEDGNVQYYDTVAKGDQESINDDVFACGTIEGMKNRARDSGSENSSQQSPEDNQGDRRNLSDTTGVIMERRHSSSSDSSLSDREYNQNQITQQNQTRPKSPQLVQDSVQQSANISTAGEAKVSHISIESMREETGFFSEPFESWSPHPDHTNRTDPDNWQENEEQFEFSDSARSTPSRSNVIQKRNDTSSSSSYLSENETTHYTVNSDQDEHIHVIDVNRPSVGINHGQPGLGKAHSFSSSSSESEGEDYKTIQGTHKGVGKVESVALSENRSSSAVTGELVKVKPIPHTRQVPSVGVALSPAAAYSSSSSSESEEENKDLQVKHKHGESQMTKLRFQESQMEGNALEKQRPLCEDIESRWPVLNLEDTSSTRTGLDFKVKSADSDSSSSSDNEDTPGKVVISDLAIQKPQTDSRVPDASWPTLDLRHVPKVKRRLDIKVPTPASSSSNSEDETSNHIKKQWQQQAETAMVPITTSQNESHGQGTQWSIKKPSPASDSSSSSDSEDDTTKYIERPGKVLLPELAIQKPQTDSRVPDASWPTLDLRHIPKVKRRLDIKVPTPASDSSSSSDSEDESTSYTKKKVQQQTEMANYPVTTTQTVILGQGTQWPVKAPSPASHSSSTSSDSEDEKAIHRERPGKVVLPELAIQKPQTDSRVPDASWPILDLRHIPKVKRRLDIRAPTPASDSSSSSDNESTNYIKKKLQQQTEMEITNSQNVSQDQGTRWPVKATSPASDSSSSSDSEDEKAIHRERPGEVVISAIQKPQTDSRVPDASWPTLDLRHIPKVKRRLDIKAKTPASDSSSSSESENESTNRTKKKVQQQTEMAEYPITITQTVIHGQGTQWPVKSPSPASDSSSSSESEDESTKNIKKQEQQTNMAKLPIKESQTALLDPETQWPLLDLEYTTHTKRRLDFKAKLPAFDTSFSSDSEDDTTKYIERPGKVLLPELAIQKPQTDSRVPDASWPTLDLMHIPKVKRRLDIKAKTPASDSSSSSDSENESTNQIKKKLQQQTEMEITNSQNVSQDQGTRWPIKATSPASDSSSSSDSEDEKAIHRERPGEVVISAIQKPQTGVPDASWPTLDLRHIPKVKRRLDIKAPTPASDSSSSSESEDESTKHIKKQEQQTNMAKLPIKESQTALLDPETQWPLLDLERTTHIKRRLDFKAKSTAFDTSSSSDSEDDTTKYIERPGKVLLPELAIQKPQTDSRVPDASWPTLDLMHIPKVKRRLDIKAPRPASDSSSNSDSDYESTSYIKKKLQQQTEMEITNSQNVSQDQGTRWPVKATSPASDSSSSSDSEDEKAIHRERPGEVVISAIQKPQADSRVPDASWPTLDLRHIPKVKRRLDIKAPIPASDLSSNSDSEYESPSYIKKKVQQQTEMEITNSQNVSQDQGTRWPVKATSPASDSSSSSDSEDEKAIHRERPGEVVISAIQKPQADSRVPDASWPTLDLRHIPKVKRRLDIKAPTPASDSSSSSDNEYESTTQIKKKVQQQTEMERVQITLSQNVSQDQGTQWPVKATPPASHSSTSSESEDESTKHIKKQKQQTNMAKLPIKESQTALLEPETQWPLIDLEYTTHTKKRLDFKAKSPAFDISYSSDSEDDTTKFIERPGKILLPELAIQKPQTDSRVPDASWPTLDLMHIPKVKRRLDIKAKTPGHDSSSSSDSEYESTNQIKKKVQQQTEMEITNSQNVSQDQGTRWPVKATSPASDSSSSSDSEDEKAIHRERPGEVVISAIQKPQTDSRVPDASWPTLDLMHIPKVKRRLDIKATSPASDSSSSSDSEVEKAIHRERPGEVVISDLAIQKPHTDSPVPDASWPTLDLMHIPKVKRRLDINAPTPASDSSSSSDSESETMPVVVATAISKTTEKYLIQSPQSPEKTSGNISTMPVINPELESRWATMTLGVSRFRKHLDVRSHAHGASKIPSSPPPVSSASFSSGESGDEGRSSRTRQKRRGTGMQGKILTESTSKVEMTPVTASLSLKSQDRSVGTVEFNERKERPLQSQTSSSSDSENDMVDHSVPDLSLGVPRVKRRLNVKATFPEPRESLSSSSNTEVTGYTATQSRQVFNIPQYRDTDSLITYKRSIFHATSPPSSPPPLSVQTMYDTKQRYSENAQKVPSYSVEDRSASVASKKSLSKSFDDLLNKMVGNSKRITELPPELRWTGVGRQMPERRLDVSVSSPPAEPKLPPPDSSSSESDDEIKQNQKPDITEHKYSSFSAGTVSSSSTRTFDTVDNSSISTNEIVWGASENRQRKGLSALKAISAERQNWDIRQEKSENSASSLFDDYGPNSETSFHYRRTENTKPLSTIPHTQQVHLSSASVDDGGATDWMYGIPSYKRHGIGNNEPPQETPPPIPATPPPSDEALGLTWRSRPNSWKERSDGTRYSLPKSRNTEETKSSSLASENLEVLLDFSNNPITKV